MTNLVAFNGDKKLKVALLREVHKHYEQDQIVKGTYGHQNGKWVGCAVGCSIRSIKDVIALHKAKNPTDAQWSAAESAAESARSAARSAAESARSAAYVKFADKLIALMKSA